MTKAYLFDIGGVIISPEVEQLSRRMAEHYQLPHREYERFLDQYRSALTLGEMTLLKFYQKLITHFKLHTLSPQDLLKQHLLLFTSLLHQTNSFLLAQIKALRSTHKVFCLVNAEVETAKAVEAAGLYHYFHRAFISCRLHLQKPDKEFFIYTLNHIHYHSTEVVFIDDKMENIMAAKRLHLKTIHYQWPQRLRLP